MATLHCLSLQELRVITTPRLASPDSNSYVAAAGVPDTALLDSLMFTALDAAIIDKHLTAACNALCFVGLRMSNSADDQVRAYAFSTHTWLGLVDVVRKAFHDGKNKPALQVLDTLSTLAQSHPDMSLARSNLEQTVINLLRILFCRDPATEMKQACIMLSFFLRKLSDFMTFPELLDASFSTCRSVFLRRCRFLNHGAFPSGDHVNPTWTAFALALILATGHPDSKSAALKLLTFIYASANGRNETMVQNSIVQAVEICSSGGSNAPANVVRTVLPAILDTPTQLRDLLDLQQRQGPASVERTLVLLTAIEVAREKSFIAEDDTSKLLRSHLSIKQDGFDPFNCLLSHHSSAVRLKAFKLLTMSNSPSVPIAYSTMDCLLRNLPVLFNDTDAYMRSEIISTMKRLCTRIKMSRASAVKGQSHTQLSYESSLYVQQSDHYVNALLEFLERELSVHQTYSRHILALHSLSILDDSFMGVQQDVQLNRFQHKKFVNRLVLLVLDAYDDVRGLAMQILHKISRDTSLPLLATSDLRAVAKLTANTNRADHADAYGRLMLLLSAESASMVTSNGVHAFHKYSIPELVSAVTSQLSECTSFNVNNDFPLHGTLLGISYCLSHKEQAMDTKLGDVRSTLYIARKIWSLSQPHLCVDSPEMETEDDDNDLAGPKDLLAYAWRALRDSNVMLQAVLRSSLLTKDLCRAIGDLTFEQLSLLRHRGAFSSVAHTFVLCCDKLREDEMVDMDDVLQAWFGQAIEQIEAQANRLTRRSAGLPSMFAAVLNPKIVAAFSKHFNRLVALASVDTGHGSSTGLPEVHALNCLKDIMTNSRFRQVTEASLLSMINLAAKRISSEVWAVKNCGLMLFRACINRLDNTHVAGDRTQENILEAATNDTDPATIATRLLEDHSNSSDPTINGESTVAIGIQRTNNEAIFASLDLLGRVYIKRKNRNCTINAITTQLGHPVWHIRAQASRLLAHIALPGEELDLVEGLLCPQRRTTNSNAVHGAYLAAYALLLKLLNVAEEEEYRQKFVHILSKSADFCVDGLIMPIAALRLDMANTLLALRSISTSEIETVVGSFDPLLLSSDMNVYESSASFKRSRALFNAYLHILAPTLMTVCSASFVQEYDSDAAIYVTAHIDSFTDPVHAARAVQLISNYLQPQQSLSVLAPALSAFAALLPRCPDHISGFNVDQIADLIDFKANGNRDWLLAQILAYAALLVHSSFVASNSMTSIIQARIPTFIRVLRLAAADQIDLPTRETALAALSQLMNLLATHAATSSFFKPEQRSELYLILYDFLSDDDEDLRAQAATTVHLLLEMHEFETRHPLPECAYSERIQLRSFIVSWKQKESDFIPEVLIKIFGIQNSFEYQSPAEAILDYCEQQTVTRNLQVITSRAQDLFAEEKQNLYIDEATEIKAWADCLNSCKGIIMGGLLDGLQKWSLSAVTEVMHLLREDIRYRHWQRDGEVGKPSELRDYTILSEQTLFSVTNNPDVLIVVLRAIIIAKLLERWYGGQAFGLECLEKICASADVHQEIEAALAK